MGGTIPDLIPVIAREARTVNHAEEVQRTVFGIHMRKPIVNGLTRVDSALSLLKGHTDSKMIEKLNEGKEEFERTLRKGQIKLDTTLAIEKQKLIPIPPEAHEKLVPIDEKCDTRVSEMTITKLSGENEYYALSFTRANGE